MNTEIALEIVKICQGFIDWGNPEKESDKQALVSKLSAALASVNANEQSQAQQLNEMIRRHDQQVRINKRLIKAWKEIQSPAPMNEVNKPEGE